MAARAAISRCPAAADGARARRAASAARRRGGGGGGARLVNPTPPAGPQLPPRRATAAALAVSGVRVAAAKVTTEPDVPEAAPAKVKEARCVWGETNSPARASWQKPRALAARAARRQRARRALRREHTD